MNSIPDDELLSAYLDGELSDEERARAEQMLAEQPESRQLLDDLRAIKSSFEGLPRHRLEADFSARVLRAAERELLAGDADGEVPAPPAASRSSSEAVVAALTEGLIRPAERPASGFDSPGFNWARWRRPMVWAGAALAAGLLLMVVDRGRQQPVAVKGPIAQAPADLEFRAPEEAAPSAARDRESRLGEPAQADGLPPLQAPEAERSLAEGGVEGALGGRMQPRSAPGAKGAAKPETPPAPAPATGFGVAGDAPAKPNAARQAGANAADDRSNANLGLRGMAGGQGANTYFYFRSESQAASEPLDPNALIIMCDVAENVAARPEFSELFLSNGIAWEAEQLDEGDQKTPADESAALAKSEKAGAAPNRAETMRRFSDKRVEAPQAEQEQKLHDQIAIRNQAVEDALNSSASDYVLLEATDEQLNGLLAEFDRHPELFLAVNVEPSPEVPSQQAYAAYNRGNVAADKATAAEDKADNAKAAENKPKAAKAKAPASTPESKTLAAGGESRAGQQLARKKQATQLGRAQRVVLQPAEPTLDALAADKDSAAAGEPQNRAKAADAKQQLRVEEGLESYPAGKTGGDQMRRSADGEPGQGYQQALIILRRVPAAAEAAAPAEKQPD